MSGLFASLAIVAMAFAPAVARAQDAAKKDATAELLAKLRKPVDFAITDELRLQDLADLIAEKHGVPITINALAFSVIIGETPAEMMMKLPKVKGLTLATTLKQALQEKNATFLVRKGHIELVPIQTAAKEAKISGTDDEGAVRLSQPLVSAIYKEKPLNEALADLAEEYDLTIVMAPQAADNRMGFVNARLLNVPADKAIEMLALQADLRVVQKGNSFFVTSKDHANELFSERLEKVKQKLEVEQLRNGPVNPFGMPGLGVPPAPKQ